jgi:leader peptidase (prepilin peptidase)/N-methyltransferase
LTIEPTVLLAAVALAVAGAVFGVAADRFATRWPEHDEEHPPGRAVDWRTIVCGAFGAFAFGLLLPRFEADLLAKAAFGAWFALLILCLATDLDQRIFPDIATLPIIPVALVYAVSGRNPFVGDAIVPAVIASVLIPLLLYLPSIPFGAGAFGIGDVKLLVGMGFMVGAVGLFTSVLVGMLVAGVVLLVLLVARRISRRSYVPLGPFLIAGALWVALVWSP